MEIVKSENLYFNYEEKGIFALDDVNISIKKGEFVAILGHNGSGKSTFAKHINCLLMPSDGEIYINNLKATIEQNIYEIRKNVGMIFQNPDNQIIATTVEEDIAFGPENLNIPSDEIRKRVDDSLKIVGMQDYAKKPPHHLSGGQKQRIAIAGVLAMQSPIIVLDEPTAMLDPKGRKNVMQTVKELSKKGITIIFITHFMEEAAQADRIIIMNNGKVYKEGEPSEIFSDIESIKKIGLEAPEASEIAHKLRLAGIDIDSKIISNRELVESLCRLK